MTSKPSKKYPVASSSTQKNTTDIDNPGKQLSMFSGTLLIHLLGGRHLAGKDKERLSDPYCIVEIGSEKFRTKAIPRNLAPRWNETFRYAMKEACNDLYLTVWDAKTKMFMGEATINLKGHKDTPFKFAKEHWFRLTGAVKPERTTDIKKLEKQRKKAAKKKKKGDFSDIITGEIGLRIGLKTDKGSVQHDLQAALMNTATRVEDYEKVAVQDIIAETDHYVDESLQSTERSKRLAEQTRELGFQTLAQLNEQGDKLRNVQDDVIQINSDLKEGERELRSISSVFGQMKNAMTSSESHKRYKHIDRRKNQMPSGDANAEDKLRYQLDDPHRDQDGKTHLYGTREMLKDGQFDHLSDDSKKKIEKTENNLDHISSAMNDLHLMAVQMGHEIDEHNRMLDELSPAIQITTNRIKKDTNKTRRQW
eukprot:CAMPEP_0201545836 /NCGR_PEP_ID=MMETSP0173_2-20130828/2262_1 /ASSEMBLY_ACC=CAM_ASM_000268 /TAXON_ID=218659 /ORGANISM="Vexillifera sp., Strain DIVA3 564/2" /LENGTH=421 /DNA_ID=CAMNT_0047954359 /DNA_START=20 /DNA_END=1285 /DNA_ORIENTATION=-